MRSATIRRVLIANRGEIALRIIRTCSRLGIETVLAASSVDMNSLPARVADHVVEIGPPVPSLSYLDIAAVVDAAVHSGVDAIHPGYGFLSENPGLAKACAAEDIVFIGPTAAQLRAVGDKATARSHAATAGLPLLSGVDVGQPIDVELLGDQVGWPILIKAVAGGGGRGMRVVQSPDHLGHNVELAMSEAQAAFGDPRVYAERYVPSARHVEVQIAGDGRNVVALGDRECSVQRRYQKILEEAPAPGLSDELRASLHDAAVTYSRHLEYRGLGTVEFLVDVDGSEFWFLEMNARIQVEHPVTEMITGLDLVEEQVWIAEERPLRISQSDVVTEGHAIECRINAEHWRNAFAPSPGIVISARFPVGAGLRVDTHIQAGSTVPPHYDSLLAKVITHGPDRAMAIAAMRRALGDVTVQGVETNVGLHEMILSDPVFATGAVSTTYLADVLERVLTDV